MAYDLDAFCHDCRDALKADAGPGGREMVRRNLERLLAEKAFVDKHVLAMEPGRHTFMKTSSWASSCCRTSTLRRRNRRRTTMVRRGRSMVRRLSTPT